MPNDSVSDALVFPRAGVAARRWGRFEREYRAWLQTSEGAFAIWRAMQAIDEAQGTIEPPPPTDGS